MFLAACSREQSGAIILEKEHIAQQRQPAPSPSPVSESSNAEPALREMREDEIAVDGVVMKTTARGTSDDPRAMQEEQWLVKVRTTNNGRTIVVHANRTTYEKLHAGDKVNVSYRVGKYTGTVWSADIE